MRAGIEDAAEAGTQVVGVCRAKTETKASAIAGARTRRAIMGIADRGVPEVPIHQRICGIIVQPVRVLNLRDMLWQVPAAFVWTCPSPWHRQDTGPRAPNPQPRSHSASDSPPAKPTAASWPQAQSARRPHTGSPARDIWRLRPWLPARAGWRRSGDDRSHVLVPVTLPMGVSLSSLTGSHWNLATSL